MWTFGGGGGKQRIWAFWGTKLQIWSYIHKKSRKSSHNGKTLKNRTIYRATLDYKRSYLHLRRSRKEISQIFLNKRGKRALKRPLYGMWFQIVDLWPAWGGGRIPLISPPAYAHVHSTPADESGSSTCPMLS